MYWKKNLLLAGCLAFALSHVTVASAQNGNRFMVDKIVGIVGNSAIYYSDVVERSEWVRQMWKTQNYTSGREAMDEAFESLLLEKLLYNQAQIDSLSLSMGGINQEVNHILDSLVEASGSVKAMEEKLGKPMFEIRQDYQEKFIEESYASMMRMEVYSKATITPGEVDKYFRRMAKDKLPIVPEQYVYAQITKYPISKTEAQQRTRERLLELRERIINGDRFDTLARIYSEDRTAAQGGEIDYVTLDHLVGPFADALSKLQIGQVSEVVETEHGFHLIQLLDKKGNLYKSRHILLTPKYTDQELAETAKILDSLANEIRLGTITFSDAAKQYSDDTYSRNNEGIANNHELLENFAGYSDRMRNSQSKFTKEMLGMVSRYDVFKVPYLKVGEISDAYQAEDLRGNPLAKIVKLIEVIPAHTVDIKDDYLVIEEMALREKQDEYFNEWLNSKIETTYIHIDDMFKSATFENPNWVK